MSEIYEGPINVRRGSNNPYCGDEMLHFPDGQEVALSRDMWDTRGGSVMWRSDELASKVMSDIAMASKAEGDVVSDASTDGSIHIERVNDPHERYHATTTYEAHVVSGAMGVSAVRALLGDRSSTTSVQLSLAVTASPTVAGRSEQVAEILSSR